MHRLNILFSLFSFIALVIIIERLLPSPFIGPYNSIRLHQLNQTILFIGATVVLSFFYLKEFTQNFTSLSKKGDMLLAMFFVIGVYLYGAGEGWHEVASFTWNTYCSPQAADNLCRGLYINDYYTGNIIFFVGGLLMNIPLLVLSLRHPTQVFNNKNITILTLNSIVYAFTWFAYAAFDEVGVGLFFSAVLMIISGYYFFQIYKGFRKYPFVLYSFGAYTLATAASAVVRFG